MEKTKKTRLNLGCGLDYRQGYINIDSGEMFPDARVDGIAAIEVYERNFDSVDEILLSHVVMYLRPEELQPLLNKWFKWLKVGGKLIIETAHFEMLCEIVGSLDSEKVYKEGLINIFGREKEPPHRWGWYPHSLNIALGNAGFQQMYIEKGDKKPNRDFKITATK